MKRRITLKKKSDPGQFSIPCIVQDIEFPHALCDIGASVSILPRVMAFGSTGGAFAGIVHFLDCSQKSSGIIVRDLELCLTLIDLNAHYDHIPIKKPQMISRRINDSGIIATCHYGDEYETEYSESIKTHTTTSVDSGNQKSTDIPHDESVDSNPNEWENDYYNPAIDAYTRQNMHTDEADEHHHESFALETVTYTPGADKLQDSFTNEELLNMQKRDDTNQIQAEATRERTRFCESIDTRHQQLIDQLPQQSIDINNNTSIDNRLKAQTTLQTKSRHTTYPPINIDVPTVARQPEFGERAYDLYGNKKFYWEEKDEYGFYRDDREFSRDLEGQTIPVHNKDIRRLLERCSRDEPAYICLPEHAIQFTQTKLVPEIYTKDENNEIFYVVCGEHDRNKEAFQMKLDVEAIQGELMEIQSYIARRPEASISIDRRINNSIDTNRSASIDSDTNRGRLVLKTTFDMSNTAYHGKEISAATYATLTRHQINLESLGERLQRIENTTAAMKDKWCRGDEAMRDFTGTWFNKRKEEMDTGFPTSPSSQHY
uniref:Uncharacterized protein n=1 Tax=Brassica campestris TaxID=3711 RepID=M4F2P1_BRACM